MKRICNDIAKKEKNVISCNLRFNIRNILTAIKKTIKAKKRKKNVISCNRFNIRIITAIKKTISQSYGTLVISPTNPTHGNRTQNQRNSSITINHGGGGAAVASERLHDHGGAGVALAHPAKLLRDDEAQKPQVPHGVQRSAGERVGLVAFDLEDLFCNCI